MRSDSSTAYDRWLDEWIATIRGHCRSALDVGCGPGYDTEVLRAWAIDVTATDVSETQLERSRSLNPGVRHICADARSLTPFGDASYDLVVASLSLHYFSRDESHSAFRSIWRVLRDDGLLAFRVNAWDDYHFGAPKVLNEWQLVSHEGAQKQFYTETMIRELLDDRFLILAQAKASTSRYGPEKSYIRVLCRKEKPTR